MENTLHLILLCLVAATAATDYYFYADIRWDNVEENKADPDNIPFDHGLRILPGLYTALDKLNDLNLWTASLQNTDGVTTPSFYHYDPLELYWYYWNWDGDHHCTYENGTVFPDDTNIWDLDCLNPANYDIGTCIVRSNFFSAGIEGVNFCEEGKGGKFITIFQEDKDTKYKPLKGDGNTINLILPDGTGLSKSDRNEYTATFGDVVANPLLQDMNERITFIAERLGNSFSGIVGSSKQAYNSALIANKFGVPNIVTSALDDMWPIVSEKNFPDRLLDNSLVLGYENWMILDMLSYLLVKADWGHGSMQIVSETGYSEELANVIKENIGPELLKKSDGVSLRVADDIYHDVFTKWDYYVKANQRNTDADLEKLLTDITERTRVILLMGKQGYLRNMLIELYDRKMTYYSDTENLDEQYGIIIIPENGVPCGNIWQGTGSGNDKAKAALEGAFLICHNAHHTHEWLWRNTDTMTMEFFSGFEGFMKWNIDPPEVNTWADYSTVQGKYVNRTFQYRDAGMNMTRWELFDADFRAAAKSELDFTYPADQEVSGIAGFAHDSLIWGMFTAMMRDTHPNMFVDGDRFSLMKLFANGLTDPDTVENDKADKQRIGWPGMFSLDTDTANVIPYDDDLNQIRQAVLVNDGPWSDFSNRYTFKDNRPWGGVAHTIKRFNDSSWTRFKAMLPHRRPIERDGYTEGFDSDYVEGYNLEGSAITTKGYPRYENFMYYDPNEVSSGEAKFINATETECQYDGKPCALDRLLKWLLPCAILGLILVIAIVLLCIFWLMRTMKYNSEVGAMRWKLPKENIDFEVSGLGLRSSMMGGTTIGTVGTVGTKGTMGTRGGDTLVTVGTAGQTAGTFYSMATFQTLGTNMSMASGRSDGKRRNQVFAQIAVHNSRRWAVKTLTTKAEVLINKGDMDFLQEMKEMHDMNHDNIAKFAGICQDADLEHVTFLTEYCTKGSLQDVLEDEGAKLDVNFKLSFISDIIKGMNYLSMSKTIGSHGYLKSSNLLVSSFFTIKIADFGALMRISDKQRVEGMGKVAKLMRSMWTAPEILRNPDFSEPRGTKEGDVYSFGIICHEILEQSGPFNTHDDGNDMGAEDVIRQVIKARFSLPFRPVFSGIRTDHREIYALQMAKECWAENPDARLTFSHLNNTALNKLKDESLTLIQTVLRKIQSYAKDKERLVRDYSNKIKSKATLFKDTQKTLMPKHVIEKLTIGEQMTWEKLPVVSILCLDIVGMEELFEEYSEHLEEAWKVLETVKNGIVKFTSSHEDLFCVNSSASCHVVISNVNNGCPSTHTSQLVQLVNEVEYYIGSLELPFGVSNDILKIRASIDSGSMVGGLVAEKHRRYQVYGDVYETAESLRPYVPGGSCVVTNRARLALGESDDIVLTKFETPASRDLPPGSYYKVTLKA